MKKGLISLLFLLSCGVWDAAAQDLIVKKDGTNVEAKVLEIGEKDIKYKKASHLDGPTYLVSVANVVYIRFEDGSTDIFSQEDYDRLAAEAKNPAPQKQSKRSAPSAFAGRYQPGDYFDENGVRGIVIEVDAEGHGIVMSIAQANLRWCEFKKSDVVRLGLDDQHDGAVNQAAFARMADEGKVRWEDYPAFKWCRDLGEGWYLPAINEVLRIGHLYNNGRIKFDRKAREQFNNRLKEHGGVKMDRLMYYFSSTEGDDAWTAMTTHMGIEPPFVEQTSKNISFLVRAMHKF